MKKRVLTVMGMLALGATMAFAGTGEGGKTKRGSYGGAGMGPRIEQELGLSAEQKQQIEAIRQSSHDANAAFFKEVEATRGKMREAKKARDTAAIEALKATVEEQRAKIAEIRKAEKEQIDAILTEAQKARRTAIENDLAERRGGKKAKAEGRTDVKTQSKTQPAPAATPAPAPASTSKPN